MSFSADALGFYLQVEDQLTPALEDAAQGYRKFVKDLEKWNKAAYKSASSGLGSLADLAEAFDTLPDRAVAGYKGALAALKTRLKPLTQQVNLQFTPASKKALSDAIGSAVVRALAGTKLRLGASFPKGLIKYFDQSKTLRSLYQGMPQPPDMVGKLEPKKFKKGGPVTGGTPGKDSVLSLLEPGEFVLPKDFVDKVGKMRNDAGQFIATKAYTDGLAKLTNLTTAMHKLKVAVDNGLATNEQYDKGLQEMRDEMDLLTSATSSLTYQQKVRLAPAIDSVRKEMEGLQQQAEETGKTANTLLGKILGPARFLAVSAAAEKIVDSLGNLKDGGLEAFDALGGGQIESFTTNMNQMNTRLNLSRSALREFKREAADVADLKDLNINEMSEAMEGMVQAGLKNQDMLLRLAPAATDFARSSMVAFDTSAQAAVRLADGYKFTEDQIAATFDNIRMFQANSFANAEELTTQMLDNMQSLGPALLKESTQDQQAILSNMARLGASLADTWADETGSMTGLLSRAMGGELEAMQSVGLLFGKTQDELADAFKSGNLTGLLDGLAGQIQQLTATGNVTGLEALRTAMGFEGTAQQFAMLGRNIDGVNGKLDELGTMQHTVDSMADAQANLTETADSTRTIFEQWSKTFGQLAAKEIPMLGISIGDVVDFTQEMNATTLLSIGYLAKLGVQAGVGTVKGLLAMASGLGGLLKKLTLFGTATKAATAATAASSAASAATTGGLFAGLSAGLTALAGGVTVLGTALLSPPGIAFTVSLVATMLALGGALRIATPALKVFGDVAVAGIGKAVEAFGMLVPVLLQVVDVAGTVLLGAIDGIVQVFQSLFQADVGTLVTMGPALVGVAAGIGAIATASAALSAVQFGQGILSFFTGGPTDAGSGVFGMLASMIGSIRNLRVATPDAVRDLTATVNGLGGFAIAYTRLVQTLGGMPVAADVTPRLKNLADSLALATRATGLQQTRATSAVAPSQLQSLVDAILNNPAMDAVAAASERTNELLAKILDALAAGGGRQSAPTPVPAPSFTKPRAGASGFTQDIASFGY